MTDERLAQLYRLALRDARAWFRADGVVTPEDFAQEAIADLLASGRVDPTTGYFLAVVRNTMINHLQHTVRTKAGHDRRMASLDRGASSADSTPLGQILPEPADTARDAIARTILEAVIARAGEERNVATALAHAVGYTPAEIAARGGVDRSSVLGRLSRFRRGLIASDVGRLYWMRGYGDAATTHAGAD